MSSWFVTASQLLRSLHQAEQVTQGKLQDLFLDATFFFSAVVKPAFLAAILCDRTQVQTLFILFFLALLVYPFCFVLLCVRTEEGNSFSSQDIISSTLPPGTMPSLCVHDSFKDMCPSVWMCVFSPSKPDHLHLLDVR